MFSLFKKNKVKFEDYVWTIEAAKYKFIVDEAQKTDRKPILIISAFDETISQLEKVFSKFNVDNELLPQLSALQSSNKIEVLHAEKIDMLHDEGSVVNSSDFRVLFMEHYPLLAVDESRLRKLANALPAAEIVFLYSLDGPLMKRFGADRIKEVMTAIGVEDGEMISHSMISKSITNAQKKNSENIERECKTQSEAEWYEANQGSA